MHDPARRHAARSSRRSTYDFGVRPAPRDPPRPRRSASTTTATTTAATGINVESVHRRRGHAAPGEDDRRTGRTCTCASAIPTRPITGVHRYAITYTVQGAPQTFADHDELYWDAIGNQWPYPITNAHVTVTGPQPITARRVLRGTAGQLAPVRQRRRRATRREHASRLRAAVPRGRTRASRSWSRIPKGTIQPPPATDPRTNARRSRTRSRSRRSRPGSAADSRRSGIAFVVVLATRRGRDRRFTGSAVDAAMGNDDGRRGAGADPRTASAGRSSSSRPTNIRPGQVGTLVDEQANLLDVTASIVDLAVRGFLTITELEPAKHERHPDYELTATPGKGKGTLLAVRAAAPARAVRQPATR